jgi:hypothetical protein
MLLAQFLVSCCLLTAAASSKTPRIVLAKTANGNRRFVDSDTKRE